MKTIFLYDLHGSEIWKQIVNFEKPNRIIFGGDYFDSFQISTEKQVNNFLDIVEYKKNNEAESIMLFGNHDHHYFSSIGNTGTSGYQQVGKYIIEPILDENKKYIQSSYQFENILCTHAGVSEVFMNQIFGIDGWKIENIVEDLNELFKYKPHAFTFNGFDASGDDEEQTPIWIRPKSLMRSSKNIKKEGIIQIVGHTHYKEIDIKGKSTGGKYFFVDTLPEYLIYENKEFRVGKIKSSLK